MTEPLKTNEIFQNINADVGKKIMSYLGDRRDFRSLQQTCKFFHRIGEQQTYRQLSVPPLDYNAFVTDFSANGYLYLRDKTKKDLQHNFGGDSVSTHLELKNGLLLSGTYADRRNNNGAQVCVWEIPSGKRITELKLLNGQIDQFIEIKKNIVAIAQHEGLIEIYDFNHTQNPVKLASIKLPGNDEHVSAFALSPTGQLAMANFVFDGGKNCKNYLRILDVSADTINDENISLKTVGVLPKNLTHYKDPLFWLNDRMLAMIGMEVLQVIDTQAKDNNFIQKTIQYPEEKMCFPHALQLKDGKILTAHTDLHSKIRKNRVYIWDLLQPSGHELSRTINLPAEDGSRGYQHLYQKINGEVMVVSDGNYCGIHIMKLDLTKSQGKELVSRFRCDVGESNFTFLDDTRYILQTIATRLEFIRVPQLKAKPELVPEKQHISYASYRMR